MTGPADATGGPGSPGSPGGNGGNGAKPGRGDRLLSKRVVLVLVFLGAALLLVSGSRVWIDGTVDNALGATALHGTGSQVAKGVLGAALVGAAAAVAAATAGRVVRVLSSLATVLAAALALVVVIRLLLDPGVALGELAASHTGHTGSVPATGSATAWPWIAGAAAAAMGVGGLLALLGGHRWSGLSKRYDAPSPRQRTRTAWDQLSEGEDPTGDEDPREESARGGGRPADRPASEGRRRSGDES